MRTTHREVTFAKPFVLSGIEGVLPPGAYVVATDEEAFSTETHTGFRRVATSIAIRARNGATESHPIDPVDLEVALMRDAGTTL